MHTLRCCGNYIVAEVDMTFRGKKVFVQKQKHENKKNPILYQCDAVEKSALRPAINIYDIKKHSMFHYRYIALVYIL